MDLIYDGDNNGWYWQLFDDGSQRTSQLFDSKLEALEARDENKIIWS